MPSTLSAAAPVISPGCGSYIDLPAETLDANDDGAAVAAAGSIVVVAYLKAILTAATQKLTLTGAITPASHAVSTLTSDTTAPAELSTVTIGSITYRFTDAITRAARNTLTTDNTEVSDGQTVTIGAVTYRFKDTMAAINDIQIGIDADTTLGNLVAAINADAGEGTKFYTGTVVHPTVSAGAVGSHATLITAKTAGAAGNSIVSTTTATHLTWTTASTLAGGHNDTAYDVLIGISAAAALDNLKLAINKGSTEGTNYGTGTVAHPTVIATTNADTTQIIQARTPGVAGNSIATTVSVSPTTHATWTSTVMAGGVAGETVTIDGRTYTFIDALTETSGAAAIVDQVLFGADSAAALDNLLLAINAGATAGTNYSTGTVVHATVTATTNTNTEQTVAAKVSGSAANAIAVSDTITAGAWGAATLAAGYDHLVITVGNTHATGTITYGTPTVGDTVTVNGFTYTCGAAKGTAIFSSITELTAFINEIPEVTATDDGSTITITAVTFGAAGQYTLANTGLGLTVSGATMTGGTTALTQGTSFNATASNNQTATNIAAAIDALDNVASTASVATAAVAASATGAVGNTITLATSSTAAATVSGAVLTAGIGADTLRKDTDVLECRGLHSVAMQVVAASGTHNTHVLAVYESMDGTNFIESAIAVTGVGIASGITYARYVKVMLKTKEGGASTVTVRLYLS